VTHNPHETEIVFTGTAGASPAMLHDQSSVDLIELTFMRVERARGPRSQ
jgi:hypothetical protein